ncbi:hypothetical protein Syun_022934 [Stephania yunnanensis]|uniref:Uncharacterized protein n=1 Tax=Stephania yunnanensis TaxID=152371 RepID=A0AAP0FEW3_9MAGN
MSLTVDEKKNVEKEIQALNAKLAASTKELARKQGNVESQYLELFRYLDSLDMFLKDNAFLFSISKGFKNKIESLNNVNLLIEYLEDRAKAGLKQLQVRARMERALQATRKHQDNYVVQGLVDQNMFGYADRTTERLKVHFVALSMLKFSSNVVEKILHNASIGKVRDIINEIVEDLNVLELFEDWYGNFVIQKALTTTAKHRFRSSCPKELEQRGLRFFAIATGSVAGSVAVVASLRGRRAYELEPWLRQMLVKRIASHWRMLLLAR